MEKPSKEPKEKKTLCSDFYFYIDYTPDDLHALAYRLSEKGIIKICFEKEYCYDHDWEVYQYVMETEQEAYNRYNNELKQYEKYKRDLKKNKETKKNMLIKECKKLGLKVTEE